MTQEMKENQLQPEKLVMQNDLNVCYKIFWQSTQCPYMSDGKEMTSPEFLNGEKIRASYITKLAKMYVNLIIFDKKTERKTKVDLKGALQHMSQMPLFCWKIFVNCGNSPNHTCCPKRKLRRKRALPRIGKTTF